MTPDPDDDDAFSWEGDEHPTRAPLHRPAVTPTPPALVPAATPAAARASSATPAAQHTSADHTDAGRADAPADAAAARAPMGNVALVASGILGGIYLLYAIGWIIGGLRVSGIAGYLVSSSGAPPATWAGGNVVGIWLAAFSPVLWFVTVWIVTRRTRAWVRWAWLIAGAVLLVPWPLFMLGAQG